MKITPFMLDSYAHEYADLVKVRDAHATEMDGLRNSNRNLTAQVCVPPLFELVRKVTQFLVCSQNMEASMTQLNDEHREVLVCHCFLLFSLLYVLICVVQSQLDIARQKNEELESELVRYKFL